MNLIEISLKIAMAAHEGQVDKAGKPYILHPLRVMLKMDGEKEMATAILHDVLEDSAMNLHDLRSKGIPEEVIEAVLCLTKRKNESYINFIDRILTNRIAKQIKIADIEDNINVLRIPDPHEEDFKRLKKYHDAWNRLTDSM